MTPTNPESRNAGNPGPGFWEQIVMTVKILLAAGALLGGIWLLDSVVTG